MIRVIIVYCLIYSTCFAVQLFEPSIQCTVVKVYSTKKILGFQYFPRKFHTINNVPHTSKLSIGKKEFKKLNPRSISKTLETEIIMIDTGNGKLELKLTGKAMSRTGELKISGEILADLTCH